MTTVLVCTRDRRELLARCLDAIRADLGPADELLVVDAADVPVPGKSRQLNAGLRAAASDVVVMTDDDCVVPAGWIAAMAAAVAPDGVAAAFGPVRGLSSPPGAPPPRQVPAGPAPLATWEYAHGAAMAVRRDVALAVGGFDEALGPGAPAHGEEHDLALRLLEAGHAVVVAAAPPVEHVGWRSAAEDAANVLVYERGAGAVVGRALRRAPRRRWRYAALRLRYQAQRFRSPGAQPWRSLAAFAGGVAYGLRRPPR
jgi:GT2 family glycosyltransferase